jgi:hypothetical protein
MFYRRLTKGLNDSGILVSVGQEYDHITDPSKDYYLSLYYYNQDQFNRFKDTGSVSGVTDVVTPFLFWDFDSESTPDQARKDTLELASRLMMYGLNPDDINIYFSGKKGFAVEVLSTELFTPEQFRNITRKLSEGLRTRDDKIVNPSRIIRVPNTRHQDTKLFKRKLNLNQLELPIDEIKKLAQTLDGSPEWSLAEHIIPAEIKDMAKDNGNKPLHLLSNNLADLDYTKRPKGMSSCLYTIQEGYFEKGNRNDCLMALATYYKSKGYNKEVAYNILKAVARVQHQRHPEEKRVDKAEIWNTVVQSVYGPNWQGGVYSCKHHDFMKKLCPPGPHNCDNQRKSSKDLVTIDSISNTFTDYAKNIDKNTIQTGILEIDQSIRLQTKSHVVLAGCSGSGKTTLLLNLLANTSAKGLKSVFGSMDMSDALIYQKLAHKVSGLNDKQLYSMYGDPSQDHKRKAIDVAIKEQFQNTLFDFSSGVTIEQLEERLRAAKNEHGDSLKLAVYDYINLIGGPYSDATANLNHVAPRLKDLANDLDLLIISLAQIGRDKGGPSKPLKDSRVAKGSSAIEESATVLLGIWRTHYNTINDNYVTIAGLKTRMGKEFVADLHWNGLTSEIRSLTEEERIEYEHMKEALGEDDKGGGGWH